MSKPRQTKLTDLPVQGSHRLAGKTITHSRPELNRSNAYQYKIRELPFPIWLFTDFLSPDYSSANSKIKEEIAELEDQLNQEFLKLINTLPQYQFFIIIFVLQQKSQKEIAKLLKVNQSSINHQLMGHIAHGPQYKTKKRYGGIYFKLEKAAKNSPIIQEIKRKLIELYAELDP